MKQTIGEFLATQRKAKGYTQQYVADILGVSNRTLSAWETNKAYPDILTLPALAELYGVTVDEILGGERSTAELKTEEISQKAQSDLYKNRLAQYSSKNTAFIVTGVCGAVAATFGLIFLFVIGWLGLTLIVLGTLASIVAITLLVACSKNAVTSAGIFTFDQNLSKANKSFILNIAIMRSRILSLLCLVWLGCAAVFATVLLIWLNSTVLTGLFFLIPFIAAVLLFTAAVTDRNTAIKKYGTEENKTVLKRNSKLLAKCLGFSCIPAAVVIVVFAVLAAVASSSWLVLYEGEEKDFRQYMHTLQQFSCNVVFPDFADNYDGLIPDPVVLDIPEEIKSGEYFPVYEDLLYAREDDSVLSIFISLEIATEEEEEVKKDYFYLCCAERLAVKDSDILVYNIRFTDGVNYGGIQAEYNDGVYTVLGKNDYVVALDSLITFTVLAVTGPIVGTTIYFCKRTKQRFTIEA